MTARPVGFVCTIVCVGTKSSAVRAIAPEPAKPTPTGAHTSSVGPQTAIVDGWKLLRRTNSSDCVPPGVDLVTFRKMFQNLGSGCSGTTQRACAHASTHPRLRFGVQLSLCERWKSGSSLVPELWLVLRSICERHDTFPKFFTGPPRWICADSAQQTVRYAHTAKITDI